MISTESFKGFKSIESRPFSKETLQSLVKHTTPNPPVPLGSTDAASAELGMLLTRLGCTTILIENNYTDRDYKAEYSAFYSKRFFLPPARCVRLHFFTTKPSKYGQITTPNDLDPLIGKDSYLGFCVVRPTEFFRIGRTVIRFAPPATTEEEKNEYYLTCRGWYTTHLLGREFKILGMPFIQQDTQVGACAHAALWMVGRYMHVLGHCGELSVQQINHFAKSRQPRGRHYPAQDGLASGQMLDALHEMGLFAVHYNDFNTKKFNGLYGSRWEFIGALIYFYVESGFPVIIVFRDHVIVAIGHTLTIGKLHKKTIARIPSFIIHDDVIAPYGEFFLQPNDASSPYRPDKIEELIAVLPGSVHLQGEYAESLAHVIIQQFTDDKNPITKACKAEGLPNPFNIPDSYRIRTYLLKSVDFLTELQSEIKAQKIPMDAGNLILLMEFPMYIWVSEVFASSGENRDTCVGKLLFDSTGAPWDKNVIAILMEKTLILFDRQHLEESPLIQPLVENWKFNPRNAHGLSVKI